MGAPKVEVSITDWSIWLQPPEAAERKNVESGQCQGGRGRLRVWETKGVSVDEQGEPEPPSELTIHSLGPDEVGESAASGDPGLTVLPLYRLEDGRGVYGEPALFLVKELRAEGISARFLDDSSNRTFEAKFGYLDEFVLPYVLGIASSAGWDGLKALARRLASQNNKTKVQITVIEAGSGAGWRLEGEAREMPAAVERLQQEVQDSGDGE